MDQFSTKLSFPSNNLLASAGAKNPYDHLLFNYSICFATLSIIMNYDNLHRCYCSLAKANDSIIKINAVYLAFLFKLKETNYFNENILHQFLLRGYNGTQIFTKDLIEVLSQNGCKIFDAIERPSCLFMLCLWPSFTNPTHGI